MTTYIPEEKLNAACQMAADTLGVDVEVFKRAVFENKQEEYDRNDIINWFDDQGYVYTDDDVDQILCTLRDDWDADRGTWSNIESAYYNNNMHLPYADDMPEEDEEVDEEELHCRATFPQCQKCKHSDECEAYQHALKVQTEIEANGEQLSIFAHDTTGCETFEPADGECDICTSDCPLHADCPAANARITKVEEEADNA